MEIKGCAFDCYECEIFHPNYNCNHHTEFSREETKDPGKRWIDQHGIQHCNDFVPYRKTVQLTLF